MAPIQKTYELVAECGRHFLPVAALQQRLVPIQGIEHRR
jgi:hypothetical protein